ncbi:dihydroneopterin aldolase [Pedobacter rhizosphaerae]|uniref:7,8-dihydroneopterin aldolase n=1 Tax=Pedobacter rhizosphaerae TaxID=390241 RepID=A0A1H9U7U1_9SPHI|nr:dihydroneopterin aldolase [Pedobacter rhizosphaerae]SES05217.1 dihydroneopterin aldolase [Pedobacter rhizosphaerae]
MSHFKQTVALKEVKCFALHGYYPEEQLIGNHFVIDLETEFTALGFDDELSQTVNYEDLNTIILEEMKNTQKLLETVLKNIISKVIERYPFVENIKIGMKKLNPPMLGQISHSFVQLYYTSAK